MVQPIRDVPRFLRLTTRLLFSAHPFFCPPIFLPTYFSALLFFLPNLPSPSEPHQAGSEPPALDYPVQRTSTNGFPTDLRALERVHRSISYASWHWTKL